MISVLNIPLNVLKKNIRELPYTVLLIINER